jgi:hypothetical protein
MTPLPLLAAHARRALAAAGVQSIEDLGRFREAEIAALHGMGPNAMSVLRQAMDQAGQSYRGERPQR